MSVTTYTNASAARHLAEEPLSVHVSLGYHQVVSQAPALTCHLVERAEGVQARFSVFRDDGTPGSTAARHAGWVEATVALQDEYNLGLMSATQYLDRAERRAWAKLADRGYDLPAEWYED